MVARFRAGDLSSFGRHEAMHGAFAAFLTRGSRTCPSCSSIPTAFCILLGTCESRVHCTKAISMAGLRIDTAGVIRIIYCPVHKAERSKGAQ